MPLLILSKDDNGSSLEWISADFGFVGCGFGFRFSPTSLRIQIPETPRVWSGFYIAPMEVH
jgi:hypothetical protein